MSTRRPTTATVDRFEASFAILIVRGRERKIARSELSAEVKEGDVIRLDTLEVDAQATETLREEVRQAREKASSGNGPMGGFDL